MLVIMVGIRKLLDCVFTQRELKILDDALPEFSRKEKIEEEGDEENEDEEKGKEGNKDNAEFKRERLMSISLANGGIIKSTSSSSVNFSEEVNQLGLWSLIDNNLKPTGSSNGSSRRTSISGQIRNRRKSSILEPIFSPHSYPSIYEHDDDDTSLRLPTDALGFFRYATDELENYNNNYNKIIIIYI
ncbi:hypothetical protein Avbf_02960 [Armadillidium vulgare]|nr:hypothetical protein Avbf_02960 [Armadillidium vulgare]